MLKESERLLSTVVFKDVAAGDIVKKGIENISKNYMNSEFLNQYFNWKGLKMDSSVVDFQERYLIVEEVFSNRKGARNVLVDSTDRSKSKNSPVADVIYGLSDNLYFDLIKSGAAIFNAANFHDWEFTYLNRFDSTNTKDVVILGNRLGMKGFNQLIFYIDIENFAFKRVDFSYQWEDTKILNQKVNDSLYYSIDRIEGVFLYARTAKKYNLKYQFLKVDYSFQYRSVVWNQSSKKFKGVYYEEMNVLCSTQRREAEPVIPPCNLEAAVVNTTAYDLLRR